MTRHRRHLMWQRVPTHNTKGGEMNVHRTRGVGVLVAAAALFALAVSAPARADTVTDWNAIASTAIVSTAGQSPQAAT